MLKLIEDSALQFLRNYRPPLDSHFTYRLSPLPYIQVAFTMTQDKPAPIPFTRPANEPAPSRPVPPDTPVAVQAAPEIGKPKPQTPFNPALAGLSALLKKG